MDIEYGWILDFFLNGIACGFSVDQQHEKPDHQKLGCCITDMVADWSNGSDFNGFGSGIKGMVLKIRYSMSQKPKKGELLLPSNYLIEIKLFTCFFQYHSGK